MTEFTDKVVLITGAAGNLGRATAQAFHDAGARLALVGRNPHPTTDFPKDLDALWIGGMDLTRPEAAVQTCQRVVEELGALDVLFNAVGGFRGGHPLHEEELETWDFLFDVNLRTTLLICRAVVPHMLARGGRIVNTAGGPGFRGVAGLAAYSAAKAGVLRLTESLAEELRSTSVTVNCVVPGTIDTPQNRRAMPDADFGTWVSPATVADVVLFLASVAARGVTGAAIPVDHA